VYTVLFILWPWYGNLFSGPGKVLVLVLVLVLTKKSWSWSWSRSWSWINMEVLVLRPRVLVLVLVLVLTKKSYLHHYSLLYSTDFFIPRTRTRKNSGERSFSVSGPTAWNSLPESLRTVDSIVTFKRQQLKTHFFSMTFICVNIFNSFLLRLLCCRPALNANTGRVLIVGWVVPEIGQAASDVIRTVNGWLLLGVLHSHQQVVHMRSGYT